MTDCSLVLAVTVFAGLVWVDGDRQATNCWGEWVDGGTSDGVCLRLKCLLGKSFHKKVIKINCQCVRSLAFAISQTPHLPLGTLKCVSFVLLPLEG